MKHILRTIIYAPHCLVMLLMCCVAGVMAIVGGAVFLLGTFVDALYEAKYGED